MKQTLTLLNPIKINGTTVAKLSYDTNEITAQMFAEADASKMRASGAKSGNMSGAVELDYGLHLYLGFAAIKAINPEYDTSDLERVHGYDVMDIMRIGRNFIISPPEEVYSPDNSEELSENMPEPSTHQHEILKRKGS